MSEPQRPSDDALAVGLDVAATWAAQDRYDPHRPVLSQVVAEAIERRGGVGRRADDGADRAALLDLLGAVEPLLRQNYAGNVERLRAAAARARRHLDRQPPR